MQTASVGAALEDADGAAAASSVFALGAAAQSIVTVAPEGVARALDAGVSSLDGDCSCTATACTFDDCGDSQFSMSGSISRSGDTYSFDLTVVADSFGFSYTWAYSGSLTITPTLLSGSLEGSGDGVFDDQQGGQLTVSWGWSVDYNDVVLEAGCPVGGSVDASVSYQAAAQGGQGSFKGSGSVSFGPTCGDAVAL